MATPYVRRRRWNPRTPASALPLSSVELSGLRQIVLREGGISNVEKVLAVIGVPVFAGLLDLLLESGRGEFSLSAAEYEYILQVLVLR